MRVAAAGHRSPYKKDCNRLRGFATYLSKGATEIQEKKNEQDLQVSRVAAAMTVSAATFLVMAAPAAAAPQHPAVDYCLSCDEGGTDCNFTSKAQCQATAPELEPSAIATTSARRVRLFNGSPRRSGVNRSSRAPRQGRIAPLTLLTFALFVRRSC